jgi:hypothetical protein
MQWSSLVTPRSSIFARWAVQTLGENDAGKDTQPEVCTTIVVDEAVQCSAVQFHAVLGRNITSQHSNKSKAYMRSSPNRKSTIQQHHLTFPFHPFCSSNVPHYWSANITIHNIMGPFSAYANLAGKERVWQFTSLGLTPSFITSSGQQQLQQEVFLLK